MFKIFRLFLIMIFTTGLLACSDSETPQEKSVTKVEEENAVAPSTPAVTEEVATQLPAEAPDTLVSDVIEEVPQVQSKETTEELKFLPSQVVYQEEIYANWPYTEAPDTSVSDVIEEVPQVQSKETTEELEFLPSQVVYQEEIYANWPYTEAPSATPAALTESVVEAISEKVSEEVAAVTSDKLYQVVDGKISENAMNGWRTYNGGGCGTCHGKGGIGAVGPNLANSVSKVLSKEEFMDVVTNGRSGTMMRPHKTNKRVMDNIEDLYVYLVARGDDVLGPGNLIKMPLGK